MCVVKERKKKIMNFLIVVVKGKNENEEIIF